VFVVELSVTGGGVTRFRLGEFETSSVRECFIRETVAQGEDEIDRFAAGCGFRKDMLACRNCPAIVADLRNSSLYLFFVRMEPSFITLLKGVIN
jgi:hypothetical protein